MDSGKPLFLCLFLFASIFILGCANSATDSGLGKPAHFTIPPGVNPSSAYCAGLGYNQTTAIKGGESSEQCAFPDSTSCEEWDFLYGKCGQGFSFCGRSGGKIQNVIEQVKNSGGNTSWTGTYGLCKFSDGTCCSELDFTEGNCMPGQCKNWSLSGGCIN